MRLAYVVSISAVLGGFAGGCGDSKKVTSDAAADAAATEAGVDSGAVAPKLSNVATAMIPTAGIGDCVVTANCALNTSTGTIGCLTATPKPYAYAKVAQSSGGLEAGLFVCKTVRIQAAARVNVQGTLPLIWVATESFEIVGELNATANLDDPVAGGFDTEDGSKMGAGPGGGAPASAAASQSAGGGGHCGKGGKGAAITGEGGAGGVAYGMPTLIPLMGGSGGGSNFYGGGGGGGAIQLVAGTTLTVQVTGVVSAGGGGGGGHEGQAGGGGSGGAILLEAPMVVVAGRLAVNGGGGGEAGGGADGANAMSTATAAPGAGMVGGAGSAAAVLNGVDGMLMGTNIGGGGGGAGRIRINTTSGAATVTGTLSPPVGSECVTQGTI